MMNAPPRLARVGALIACLAAVAGCFSPRLENGHLQCAPSGACPSGFHCASDHTCWKNGQDPDATVDLGGDAPSGSDDLASPPDMAPSGDLAPIVVPPAAVWISHGGGAVTGPASMRQLNLSFGGTCVVGESTASSGATITFGYFSNDIY